MPLTNVLGSSLSQLGHVVLGGVQKALRFGLGAQPPGMVPYYVYRVLDPVTGAVVIPVLPHRHASQWRIRGLQPGNTGTVSVGDFEIPLFTPEDNSYRKAKPLYDLLAEGQRIEGYEVPSIDIEVPGGVPKLSGVVRSLPVALNDFSLRGVDSLFLLQSALTGRTEFFSGRTDQLKDFALRAFTMTYGDDFVGTVIGAYNQAGNAWSVSSDEGLAVATVAGDSSAAVSTLLTPATFAQNTYADMVLDDYFRLVFAGNVAVQHGVIAGASGGVYVVGYLNARFVNVAKWEVDLVIATVAAGVVTPRITKTVVVVEPTNGIRGQLALIGKQGTLSGSTFSPSPSGPDYLWRLTINGADAGCTWIQVGTTPSGSVGLFYSTGAAPTGGPALFATQLVFRSRTNVFQIGITNVGGRSILQYVPRTQNLDLLTYASVTEGNVFRKNAGVGLFQDTIDWGPIIGTQQVGENPVGTDRAVRFVWGKNLLEYSQEENSDPLATDVALQLSPSGDQAGILEWHLIPAIRKYGIITDTVQAQFLADFLSARALAEVIGATKSNPGISKKMRVLRDPDTAGLWRELDFVGVFHPEFRTPLLDQAVQVLEMTIFEGQAYMDIVGDKFPAGSGDVELARMWQTLDQIAIGSSQVTPGSGATGIVYDSRFGSPQLLPFYGPYLSVDPTHNYRFRFQIPSNAALIQKVTLAFSLLPYRTYSTITLSATGSALTTHSHSHNHAGGSHTHTIPIAAGPFTNAVGQSAAGGQLQDAFGPTTAPVNANSILTDTDATTANLAHTHSISGTSINGISEDVIAQGVHLLIDSVDVTVALGGPWNGSGDHTDFSEFDITPYVLGGGWHEIQFSSTTLGAMVAQGMAFIIAKPTAT